MIEEASETDKLKECFELQLSEVEMLSSMYPDSNEFNVTMPSILADMTGYIDGNTSQIPNELDFTWTMEVPGLNIKLDVNITLQHNYPESKPLVSARSIGLNRHQQKELNSGILNYLETLSPGDLCVISLINWLTEHADSYFSLQPPAKEASNPNKDSEASKEPFCRMWIYSHHIYSKFKRRDIIDSAKDMNLTGFSLPGKPGFICLEGFKRDCSDFFQNLKQMSWKKLSLVKEETEESSKESSIDSFRKFEDFQEISFQVRRGPAKEYHMDMGQFLKFLEEHSCGYAFHDLFGIEGHVSGDK
ncbi:hypothetical protein JTE90_009983 [Oedothorax gibbosus]|uniref:RWD domain-containing protein n=1 Tax=Oedothorax gibbosus TaxID=931172 RepID=A0AAV6UEU3_9ARAC|nr:hypothetical protein JTE90_009983 [Oedothorax gibbosus]